MSASTCDIALVGAGPIGVAMAIELKRAGLDYLHIEAGPVGRTLHELWPPMTRFLSSPDETELAGTPMATLAEDRLLGEEYLAYLRQLVMQHGLTIRTHEPVTAVEPTGDGFELTCRHRTGGRSVLCGRLILATGDMHQPARLGVPGEELPHVHHTLRSPHTYFPSRVLVVGGRNSALESALRCFRAGAEVTLSYRRGEFRKHTSPKLGLEVDVLARKGLIRFLPNTVPVRIQADSVELAATDDAGFPVDGEPSQVAVDFVIVQVGFQADMSLFTQAGGTLDEQGKPILDEQALRSPAGGVYLAGTAVAGAARGHALFIETCRDHPRRILADLQAGLA